MKPLTASVLKRLADGDFHSGEALARAFEVSRASVWHAIRELDALGLDVYKVHGRGYRLPQPVTLLDRAAIERHLGTHAGRFALDIRSAVDSTNTALLERAAAGAPAGAVLAAEWQPAGRGRLGRPWHAGLGEALTFSLLWRFARGAGAFSGLSLAVGVALARALAAAGAPNVALKWPNDVLWRGRKLSGILTELAGDALGPTAAVIGIGLNVRLSAATRARIGQPAADLEAACGAAPDRNQLLARVLLELDRVLEAFAREGFAPLRAEWQRLHAHQGRRVTLLLPDGSRQSGLARGVAEDGAFLLETRAGAKRYHSGEISLRPAAGDRG
ncbi:MAG: biotin--[acetyl-CoA-carboxylase] ligase [Betaproteobacteria bacterium]|nr:biotin--[acetyl-CoA-carboxylase] ligase [Betaproteobacteria bacterium]